MPFVREGPQLGDSQAMIVKHLPNSMILQKLKIPMIPSLRH